MIKYIYHKNKVNIIKYKKDGSIKEKSYKKRNEFKQHEVLKL
jgi:hypothetical protein